MIQIARMEFVCNTAFQLHIKYSLYTIGIVTSYAKNNCIANKCNVSIDLIITKQFSDVLKLLVFLKVSHKNLYKNLELYIEKIDNFI